MCGTSPLPAHQPPGTAGPLAGESHLLRPPAELELVLPWDLASSFGLAGDSGFSFPLPAVGMASEATSHLRWERWGGAPQAGRVLSCLALRL